MSHASTSVLFIATSLLALGGSVNGEVFTLSGGNNDAEEHLTTGVMDLTSTDLEIGSEGNGGFDYQAVGVQYNLLGIANTHTIDNAFLTFRVDQAGFENTFLGSVNGYTIFAEAIDNSAEFSTAAMDISSRDRTGVSVGWDLPLQTVIGTIVTTPDLSPLVQEVVSRPGWSPNNMLTLMIFPDEYLGAGVAPVLENGFDSFNDVGDPLAAPATLTVEATPIPEPTSIGILALIGCVGTCHRRRRK